MNKYQETLLVLFLCTILALLASKGIIEWYLIMTHIIGATP